MSVSKTDILQIRKYLNGELDARAMYELELRAQNDPFLMDVILGMEAAAGDHQPQLDAIDQLLRQRLEQEKRRVVPMFKIKYWAAAACIFLTLGIGGWWLFRQSPEKEIKNNMARVMRHDRADKPEPPVVKIKPEDDKALSPGKRIIATPLERPGDKKAAMPPAPEKVIPDSLDQVNDVVVRGYVKRIREQAAGSSYIITGKEVQDNPVANVEQLLQGKVAGLNIENNKERQRTITGVITDANTGEPLPGASVGTKTFGALTQTDINGKFKIKVPASTDTLQLTFIGYKPQTIALQKKGNVKARLQPDTRSLAEVAIRGYVKRNREQTTGSSYIITGKDQNEKKLSKIPGRFFLFDLFRKKTPGECVENESFKKRFFEKIDLAEKYVTAKVKKQETDISEAKFMNALKFISKYTQVSADLKAGNGYADLETFERDKANWLNWYETNKCINLDK